jgi:hypothetical protein
VKIGEVLHEMLNQHKVLVTRKINLREVLEVFVATFIK